MAELVESVALYILAGTKVGDYYCRDDMARKSDIYWRGLDLRYFDLQTTQYRYSHATLKIIEAEICQIKKIDIF